MTLSVHSIMCTSFNILVHRYFFNFIIQSLLVVFQIPCEVSINTKAIVSKSKVLENPFEVLEPSSKVTISPRSSVYAKVQFCPTAMLTYSAMFEVTTDHPKVKLLTFELQGEGNLPQVTVVQPTLRNSKGVACMLFQQLSLQSSQALPLCLRNTGTILSRVKLHVIGSPEAFQVCSYSSELPDDGPPVSPVCFDLEPGAERECLARFTPQVVKKYRGELRLTVEDNIFERQQIQLIGEGYQDSISITNIREWRIADLWRQRRLARRWKVCMCH